MLGPLTRRTISKNGFLCSSRQGAFSLTFRRADEQSGATQGLRIALIIATPILLGVPVSRLAFHRDSRGSFTATGCTSLGQKVRRVIWVGNEKAATSSSPLARRTMPCREHAICCNFPNLALELSYSCRSARTAEHGIAYPRACSFELLIIVVASARPENLPAVAKLWPRAKSKSRV